MYAYDYDEIKDNEVVNKLCAAIVELVCNSLDPSLIKVVDVVNASGVSRSSFYRFFYDIYSLENYVYFLEVKKRQCASYKKDLSESGMVNTLSTFKDNLVYYKKLCKLSGPNSFANYHKKYWYEVHKNFAISHYGENNYTDYLDFSIKMSVYGISAIIIEWINDDCLKMSLSQLSKLIFEHFNECIRSIIDNN